MRACAVASCGGRPMLPLHGISGIWERVSRWPGGGEPRDTMPCASEQCCYPARQGLTMCMCRTVFAFGLVSVLRRDFSSLARRVPCLKPRRRRKAGGHAAFPSAVGSRGERGSRIVFRAVRAAASERYRRKARSTCKPGFMFLQGRFFHDVLQVGCVP